MIPGKSFQLDLSHRLIGGILIFEGCFVSEPQFSYLKWVGAMVLVFLWSVMIWSVKL